MPNLLTLVKTFRAFLNAMQTVNQK